MTHLLLIFLIAQLTYEQAYERGQETGQIVVLITSVYDCPSAKYLKRDCRIVVLITTEQPMLHSSVSRSSEGLCCLFGSVASRGNGNKGFLSAQTSNWRIMQDVNGLEISVGDTVLIPCKVISVDDFGDFHFLNVETIGITPRNGHKTIMHALSCEQVYRANEGDPVARSIETIGYATDQNPIGL